MARDSNRRARGKRPAEAGASGKGPPKRQRKGNDSVKRSSTPAVLPTNVVSHGSAHLTSTTVESVPSTGTGPVFPGHTLAPAPQNTSNEAVLSTLPDIDTRQRLSQEEQKKRAENNKRGKQTSKSERMNAVDEKHRLLADPPKKISKLNGALSSKTRREGHGQTDFPRQFRFLLFVCIAAFYATDVKQSSSFYGLFPMLTNSSIGSLSNSSMHVIPDDDSIRRVPHKATTTILWHLVELDDFERQQSLLFQTESELTKALVELADSRHDVVAARRQVAIVQEAYESVASKLEESQTVLADSQRKLDLALHELSCTREELERTRQDLSMSSADAESLSEQFADALHYIDELHQLLEFQEKVATNALNSVAKAAAKR